MNANRLLRSALLGGATAVLLSCADPSPLGVNSRALRPEALGFDSVVVSLGQTVTQAAGGLVACSPLAYDSVTQTISPAGGVLAVGRYTLSVPSGALDSAVTITAVAPSDTVNRVQFQPQGLTFQQPASLAMSYENCAPLNHPKQIGYTNGALQILYYVPSVDDTASQTVTGQLQHFSDYAIAW